MFKQAEELRRQSGVALARARFAQLCAIYAGSAAGRCAYYMHSVRSSSRDLRRHDVDSTGAGACLQCRVVDYKVTERRTRRAIH